MEPTDNFSQKKKKDLVAIATLFGILTEEKANRMTKPELIEFLAEQDRISKAASAPVKKQPAISTSDAPISAADLLLAAIENSDLLAAETLAPAIEKKSESRIPAAPAPITPKPEVPAPAAPTTKVPASAAPAPSVSTPVAAAVEAPAPAASAVETHAPAASAVEAPAPAAPVSAAALDAPLPSAQVRDRKAAPSKSASVHTPQTAPAAKPVETAVKKKQTKTVVTPPIVEAPAAINAEGPAETPAETHTEIPSEKPAAKTGRKSAASAAKKTEVKPVKEQPAVSEADIVSGKKPLTIPADKQEAAPGIIPETVSKSISEIAREIAREIAPVTPKEITEEIAPATPNENSEETRPAKAKENITEALQEAAPEIINAVSAASDTGTSAELADISEPVQKKRRGRPKKTSEETASETAASDSASITGDLEIAEEPVSTKTEARSRKEIITQEEIDPQEVISAEVEVVSDMDGSSVETVNYEASETQSYQPEQARENTEHKPQSQEHAADAAHHTIRTKRHSVIIKPKDEDESDLAGEVPAAAEQAADTRTSSEDKKETEVSSGPAAVSGDHAEFGPHHRTLRPKEQQQEMLSGVLEIMSEGYGFLRRENYLQGLNDIYVPAQYVRRFGLRVGDFVVGPCRPKRDADRYQALQYIKEVNGLPPERMLRRVHFDRLTPIYPQEKYVLETDRNELSTRIIDLVAPIGKGQRGMIVSPPKAGKTILLQKIANAISINNPDSKLIVLLIDERPEEVTDMQRSINGEVVYSTFDKTPENHVRIVELVLERAMRLVELGLDVIILLDSITRLARAYNLTINPTGRTLSGGLDPGALYGPKRFFGAARNIENGGSLTIVATSLIDTGSRMDEVIFEEFKGTGNMEVYLDRKLSEKRIFPAIDINKSGTRHEELLLSPVELDAVWTIRKAFGQLDTSAVTEMIISLLMKTATNNQLTQSINVSFNDKATFDAMRGTRPAGTSTNSGNGK